MKNRDSSDYLKDILDSIELIKEFTKDLDYEDFIEDRKTTYAVLKAIEIIGEAAKNIPKQVQKKNPDIPWKDMAGIRDKLTHHYSGVDLTIIWKTIQQDIPELEKQIQKITKK